MQGKIAFGKRAGDMDIDNIVIMDDVANDKNIISFNLPANQPIELTTDGKVGQSFTATEQFNTISLAMCTWNTSRAGYTFQLRKDGPFGQLVYKHAYSNAVDGSNPLYIVGNYPAGTYYFEINTPVLGTEADPAKLSQVGLWASQNNVDAYVGGTAYVNGNPKIFDLDFKVQAIGINTIAINNEYVYSPQLTATIIQSNITTFSGSDGKITVMASGGSGADQYSKDNGVTWQNSNVFYPLPTGTYQIKARDTADIANISEAAWVTITKPAQISITFSQSIVTTLNGNDGSITINASGGKGTYEYSNDNGSTWQSSNTFASLSATTYRIIVRDPADPANVTVTNAVTITQPALVAITFTTTNVTTYTGADGSITVTASGGKGTYQYSLDNGATWQSSNIFISLSAATYQIKVRDNIDTANATISSAVTITQPAAQVTLTFSQSNVTTYTGSDGSITITALGGEGTYQYSKDNGSTWQTSNTFTSLSTATYQIQARDLADTANVTISSAVTITQPAAQVTITFTQSNVTTYTGTDGSITITALGGEGTYQYSKDNGSTWQSSNTFNSLSAATYQIQTRDTLDNANITQATSVTITQPTQLSMTFSQSNVTTNTGSDGSITITAAGGKGTYQYSNDNGSTWQSSNTFTSLSAATYQIQARDTLDTANITTSAAITITQPAPLIPVIPVTNSYTQHNASINGGSDGTITVNALGGSGTYEYSKDNGQTWQSANVFNGLQAGTYTILVRDKLDTENVSITQQIAISAPAIAENPNTSDNLNLCLGITFAGVILCSSILVFFKKKRSKA